MNEVKAHIEKRLKEEQDYLAAAFENNNHALILFWTWAIQGTEKLLVLINTVK